MSQLDTKDDSPIIHSFKDLEPYDTEYVEIIQDALEDWAKTLMDDPAPLTGHELELHADNLVFTGWDTDIPPDVPSFKAPKLVETRVQIGLINKGN